MAKQLQLSIASPCHENWDAMTSVDKGKFCGSCQQQVVDFSNMSDRQIAEFFKKPQNLTKGGSVCGRFMAGQLDRNIEIPKKRIPWIKYFFQFVIPAFLVSIKTSGQKTQVKTKASDVKSTLLVNQQALTLVEDVDVATCSKATLMDTLLKPIPNNDPAVTTAPDLSALLAGSETKKHTLRTIYGTVINEKGDNIPGASVRIKGTPPGIVADIHGQFSIEAKTKDILIVSGAGIVPKEVVIGNKNTISVKVKSPVITGDEVVVVAGYAIVKRTKKENKITALAKQIFRDTISRSFRIFPNPAIAGSTVTIAWKQMKEGYYLIEFLNQTGQVIQREKISIDAKTPMANVAIPAVAAGNYFLTISNEKSGKKFTEKIIIQ